MIKKVYLYNELDDFIKNELSYNTSKKIGITGGFFNPVHAGHVNLLEEAKNKCDMLIVALNNDEMCMRKHGYSFMSWEDRVAILSMSIHVNWILENPFPTMTNILRDLPTYSIGYYLKGGDVNEQNLLREEKDVCNKKFIKILYGIGGDKSRSSSIILNNYYEYRKSVHEFDDLLKKLGDI